ncbi:MAG: helix-turn-helix domain-containing protein [Patescibacteria group bacterium]|jgi:sugar-specific transcriptional regulator TrmB
MLSQNEVQEIVTDSLKKLGVGEQEGRLYILSLKVGPASVATLATQLGVSRPQAYKLIGELEKFGLANYSGRKKFSRTFIVESPSKLQELLRKHQQLTVQTDQRLTFSMPDLLAMYQQGELPTSVRIIQDKENFLKLFFQTIEETNESCWLGSAHDFIGFISWAEERKWIAERIRRAVRVRVLLLPSEEAEGFKKTDAEEFRETRILDDAEPFETLYQVFANKIIMWQPKTPVAILIEDEYLAKMMKSVFELLWARAK